jgi:surfeit locus 1 family protein
MVQRGWAQRDFTVRTRLPGVPTPDGEVTVAGRLAAPPGKFYEPARLSGLQEAEQGPIRQNLDWAEVARQTGLRVLDASLLQTGSVPDGLLRHWPAPNTGVEKHYGYAAQWFALCALIVILYLWFQVFAPYVRTRSNRSRA